VKCVQGKKERREGIASPTPPGKKEGGNAPLTRAGSWPEKKEREEKTYLTQALVEGGEKKKGVIFKSFPTGKENSGKKVIAFYGRKRKNPLSCVRTNEETDWAGLVFYATGSSRGGRKAKRGRGLNDGRQGEKN